MISVCREIIKRLLSCEENPNLEYIKREVSSKYKLHIMPSNSTILSYAKPEERERLINILLTKPTRSISGVSVIAVMSDPARCPHGKCIYCPGGLELGSPQSYTGKEPAALRAIQNDYDPFNQVKNRISQLRAIGHPVNKVELIIMGGTFPAREWNYQKNFIKRCLDALNGSEAFSLKEAKEKAEKANIRCVGITFETRPDFCSQKHVNRILELGGTRVEIGVQVLSDEIYRIINRGHSVKDVIEATRILKDSGLKVCYHLMPGLPNMTLEDDLKTFKKVFEDPDFKPDMLKIYPCLVLENTELYKLWKDGKYNPYTTKQLIELLVEVFSIIPPWIRVQRVQRDIPAYLITAGNKKSDLREIITEELERRGIKTQEIRYREVGHQLRRYNRLPEPEDVRLKIQSYDSSEGEDIFLSFEDIKRNILIGFLRLRIPSEKALRREVKNLSCGLVRELHVFGPEVEIGKSPSDKWQHRGYGSLLLSEAERILSEIYDRKNILVTSGIGAREYYRRFNYKLLGPYMAKKL
ncbi:MAG: tRNA uridine(34) 5-carboxymethylaminomethyl modification radical SAM/GNAT enzyme Elp3 [Candidatus Odinarchaeia archaeon]